MEEHKKRYLKNFLRRTQVSLKDYIKKIRDQEVRLRSCYAETIKFSSDDFVRMILLDAAFIIELLLRINRCEVVEENDRICNNPEMIMDLWPDMLLLENQLPLFILDDLFDPDKIAVSPNFKSTGRLSIINLSIHLFRYAIFCVVGVKEHNLERESSSYVEVAHFVDLIRTLCGQYLVGKRTKLEDVSWAPNMTKLHQAGVKFRVGISTKNTFDLRFTDGILEIPKLIICDDTESVFRNLIAFEQCHCNVRYVSDYVHIMDRFVDSPKDVELLVDHGIVQNLLGDSSDVSNLINNLGIGVVSGNFYNYATLSEDLNKYCGSMWQLFLSLQLLFSSYSLSYRQSALLSLLPKSSCGGSFRIPMTSIFAALCEDLNKYYRMSWHKWKASYEKIIATTLVHLFLQLQLFCSSSPPSYKQCALLSLLSLLSHSKSLLLVFERLVK